MGGREGGSSAALFVLDGSLLRAAGQVNGIATLDSGGTLTPSQVPASIANGLTFQATWNASTNTPTLPPVSTPNPGDYWIVTTAGATALPGAAGPWTVGQCAVFNGTDWDVLQMYPLALGLPVAGASPTWVLYVDGSGNLATAATGATSGIQAYSAALAAIAGNGTPTAWGLARMLDADQAANRTALALVPGTDVQAQSTILQALADLSTTGVLARTGTGTLSPRTITGTTNLVTVSNGDGVSGNPTITVGANVYQVGGTDVAIADGGTAAGTVAGANYNLADGVGVIDPSSPYTQTTGVRRIVFTAGTAKTVNLIALSDLRDGEVVQVFNASASTITVTLDPDGTETIDGGSAGASAAYTVPARGAVGAQRLSASAWGSVQPGALSTSWRALRVYISGGTLVGQEYAQGSAGLVAVGSAVTATVEAGSSAEVTFSGANATIKAGIGTGGGAAAQSAPYKAYVRFTSLSATFQALLTTGARIAFYAQQGALDTGVTTSQWYGVLTGGLSGTYNASAETFMAIAFRQGVSAATARTLNGFSSAISNMPASNAYATWSGIVGLGLGSGNAEMLANSTSGSSTVGSQTGSTAPSAALDAVYWNATGVTSSPLVDVLVTAPELWLTVEARPA